MKERKLKQGQQKKRYTLESEFKPLIMTIGFFRSNKRINFHEIPFDIG